MDMNFLKNLRLQQIFSGMQSPDPTQNSTFAQQPPNMAGGMPPNDPNPQPTGLYDVGKRMSELYTPDMTAENRFNEMANNFPTQPESSKKRKLGAVALASLSDITGNNKGQSIFDEVTGKNQNKEDIANWKTQITPIQQAADNERATNSNARTMAHQQIADELRNRAQDELAAKNHAAAAISQQRADAYTLKATKPDFKFDFKGPTIMVADPTTGKITDTKIPTGSLTDADKIALQQTNAMARIDETGKNANTVADTRGWKIGTIPDPNDPTKQIGVRYNEATGDVQPIKVNGQNTTVTAGNGKPPVDTQQAVKQKAQETLDALNEIIDPTTGKLKPEMEGAIGKSRLYNAPFGMTMYGGQTRASDAAIKRLKNMLTIELLGEMKAQSRTGATGFGQLSVKELQVLESAASKIDPTLDEGTFTAELNRISEKLKKILQPANGLTPTTTIKKPTAQELIAKYGGKGGNQ
jgi:hypothetical protein